MQARLQFTSVIFGVFMLALASTGARAVDGPATTQPGGVTGTWKWTSPGPGGDIDFVLTLKEDGENLTGSLSGFNGDESPIHDGTIHDGKLSFKVTRDFNGNQITTTYTATLENGELKGKSETVFTQDFDGKRDQP